MIRRRSRRRCRSPPVPTIRSTTTGGTGLSRRLDDYDAPVCRHWPGNSSPRGPPLRQRSQEAEACCGSRHDHCNIYSSSSLRQTAPLCGADDLLMRGDSISLRSPLHVHETDSEGHFPALPAVPSQSRRRGRMFSQSRRRGRKFRGFARLVLSPAAAPPSLVGGSRTLRSVPAELASCPAT